MGWNEEAMVKHLCSISKSLASIDESLKVIASKSNSNMTVKEFYEDHQSKLPKGYPKSVKETLSNEAGN